MEKSARKRVSKVPPKPKYDETPKYEDENSKYDDEETVTVTEIIISLDGNEWVGADRNQEEEAEAVARTYYETIANVLHNQTEDPLRESSNYEPGYLPPVVEKPKKHKSKSKLKEDEEDPFLTVDKFWNDHTCSDACITKFTKEEIVQLRSACEALDEYVEGTNRLDLVMLAMIRALVRTKKVRNRSYKARDDRQSADASDSRMDVTVSEKERQKYTCNFMVEGQSVCRSFFLFVHNIGVKRWGRLMKIYKSEGLVEKYHGLCNRKPANTTPLEAVQFVVDFIRKYGDERGSTPPYRSSLHSPDVKVLPLGESKSSVYDKYVEACHNQVNGPSKIVSKISFNRIWRQCCPNLLTHKPRASDKFSNGQFTQTTIIEEILPGE